MGDMVWCGKLWVGSYWSFGAADPARSIYFDHLFPWMTYAFQPNGDGGLDMYVTNTFDQLFMAVFGDSASEAYKAQQALDNQTQPARSEPLMRRAHRHDRQ